MYKANLASALLQSESWSQFLNTPVRLKQHKNTRNFKLIVTRQYSAISYCVHSLAFSKWSHENPHSTLQSIPVFFHAFLVTLFCFPLLCKMKIGIISICLNWWKSNGYWICNCSVSLSVMVKFGFESNGTANCSSNLSVLEQLMINFSVTTKMILERNRNRRSTHRKKYNRQSVCIATNIVQQMRRKTKITCMPVISKGDTL